MPGAGLAQPLVQGMVVQKLDAPYHRAVNVNQGLHRRHQKRPRSAGRVEQAEFGQHVGE